jgi:prepilin signal peptidase PulO-like enzyme (type II secretory pathway)
MYNLVMLFVVVVAAMLGLIFGSAINAMVWRLYVGRSWVKGRSICPECEHVLSAVDLVPVVSWLMLRGRCRYCRAPIKDHPIVEIVTGLAFALSAYALYFNGTFDAVKLVFWMAMLVLLLVLAVYDARWFILPDKIMLPLIVVAFGYAASTAVVTHSAHALVDYLVAAVVAGGAFYAIVFFSRGRAMGGGDIKLAFCMGLILGLQGTLVALFLAFNAAAVIGLALIASGKRGRKDQIPFGPFLVGATVVAFLYSSQIVDWYLRISGA